MKRSPKLNFPPIVLRRSDRQLPAQLFEALCNLIASGDLPPGSRLPASRVLARTLGVSRNTVLAAYEALAFQGLITGRIGSGTRISAQSLFLVKLASPSHSQRLQLLREAGFPINPVSLSDPDGNPLSLHQ